MVCYSLLSNIPSDFTVDSPQPGQVAGGQELLHGRNELLQPRLVSWYIGTFHFDLTIISNLEVCKHRKHAFDRIGSDIVQH